MPSLRPASQQLYSRLCLIVVLLLVAATPGCDVSDPIVVRLPAPPPETPVVNLPPKHRQKNWLGGERGNEGSCVHASLTSHLRWQNQYQLAEKWKKTYDGGEYSDRLRRRLDDAQIKFAYTERANVAFLDWSHASGRGAILWWKPSHCCTFVGWATDGRKVYAGILDNNSPGRYQWTEREQFIRLWASYGGFALATLYDPVSPIPYPSHRVYR